MKGILHFTKMEGGGNDFIVIDDTRAHIGNSASRIAKKICHRRYSIGADGLLVLKNGAPGSIKMKYYNADGSPASFCGNGARCISLYAHKKGMAPKKFILESDVGPIDVSINKEIVKIAMSQPKNLVRNIELKIDDKILILSSIDTGVPHTVIILDSYNGVSVEDIGRKVRFHTYFQPAGTNVNFIVKKSRHLIHVRTYERGVESETLACGTGAVAAALIAASKNFCDTPVRCKTIGGEELIVHFHKSNSEVPFKDVYLEGPAKISFEGEVSI
ncbi:MAG: diaminopimelate epimerase [bacterium]